MRAEGECGQFRDLLCCTLGEFGMRVESSANCSSTDREVIQTFESLLQTSDVTFQQTCPASKFLPDRQRNCILQMSAADLYDSFEFLSLGGNSITHGLNGWD